MCIRDRSISVTSMVPTLVKAIQEQQAVIEDLKTRIGLNKE